MIRALAALLLALLASLAAAAPVTLKISCGAVGQELELCKAGTAAWAAKTGHRVEVVSTPNDTRDRLALYQQVLGSGSDKIDVIQVDVVWAGMLADQLLDLKPYSRGVEMEHFAAMVASGVVGGRLVAMPWFIDAGLLYYRSDLLDKHGEAPPRTWAELAATAGRIQAAERAEGHETLWGYVWQGRGYEGLTCNLLEWTASHGGGTIVEPDGRVSIDNPRAAHALAQAAAWVGTISPKAVLHFSEEEARGVFQAGNAVFMRNWPYVWAMTQAQGSAVRGKVGMLALPAGDGGRSAATLGGHALAVSRHSRHAALAADLVMHLTSAEVQKERAIRGSFNPTLGTLYRDPEVAAASPFMQQLRDTFAGAVPRPAAVTAARYGAVSDAAWSAAHEVLAGEAPAPQALAALAARLDTLRGGGWSASGETPKR